MLIVKDAVFGNTSAYITAGGDCFVSMIQQLIQSHQPRLRFLNSSITLLLHRLSSHLHNKPLLQIKQYLVEFVMIPLPQRG